MLITLLMWFYKEGERQMRNGRSSNGERGRPVCSGCRGGCGLTRAELHVRLLSKSSARHAAWGFWPAVLSPEPRPGSE